MVTAAITNSEKSFESLVVGRVLTARAMNVLVSQNIDFSRESSVTMVNGNKSNHQQQQQQFL